MSVIQYENIILPETFPFGISTQKLSPHYDMHGIKHWHDCFEISAIKKGYGKYIVGDVVYPMGPGDIVVLNDVEPHQLIVGDEEMLQTVLTFKSTFLYNGMSNIDDLNCISPFLERNADFENMVPATSQYAAPVMNLINEISHEAVQREKGWQLMIKAKLLALITLLSRHFGDHIGNPKKRRQLMKLRPVFQLVEENYEKEITLSQCASIMGFTPQYFSSYFKNVTGSKFIDYLVSVRINHAASMLKSSDLTVLEIASNCGFNNIGNFNSLFRQHTGLTPSAYRKEKNYTHSAEIIQTAKF